MSLSFPWSPLQSVLWMFLALTAIFIAYLFKIKRKTLTVPYTFLWEKVLQQNKEDHWLRRFKHQGSFLLCSLISTLLIFSLCDFSCNRSSIKNTYTILLIDHSASMQATEGYELTRLDMAKTTAQKVIDNIQESELVMLIKMAHKAIPLTHFTDSKAELSENLESILPVDTADNFGNALALIKHLKPDNEQIKVILIGDGAGQEEKITEQMALSEDKQTGGKDNFVFYSVGSNQPNIGITQFNARQYVDNHTSYEVLISVKNFSTSHQTIHLSVSDALNTLDTVKLSLKPNEETSRTIRDLSSGESSELTAILEREPGNALEDSLLLDNQAHAVLPQYKPINTLVVSEDNLYLEGALFSFDHINFTRVLPSDVDSFLKDTSTDTFDVMLFNGYLPTPLPESKNLLIFHDEKDHPSLNISSVLSGGQITSTSNAHEASRWLELGDANFDKLATFKRPSQLSSRPIAYSLKMPVAVASDDNHQKILRWGFRLDQTDLVLRVGFPLLLLNAFDWFSGSDNQLLMTVKTGVLVSLSKFEKEHISKRTLKTPDKKATPLGTMSYFVPEKAGIYRVTSTLPDGTESNQTFAVNLTSSSESQLTPFVNSMSAKPGTNLSVGPRKRTSVRHWQFMVVFALLLLCFEWWTYHQRITA